MWSGQDSADPQQLWGNPGHSQNAWANGGSNHGGMNYPSRQQQWPGQMSMPPAQQWGYPQQSTQWQMQQQQMGWPNTPNPGYGGYEEKKAPSNRGSGYAGYGYQVVPPSMAPQPQQQSWQGQRDVYQPRQQWDTPGRNSQSIGTWNPSGGGGGGGSGSGSSSQWQNDWQNVRESEGPGNASPGLNPNLPFDAWPGTGGEEANIMWRDPKPKKKIRDTGVQAWGDPTSQMDKILRWKEADYEEFQKGPNSSTWNQGGNPWAEQSDSSWPANVWESSEAVLAEDNEPRALHFPEDSIRGYCGTKLDFANAGGDISDPNVFALNNAFQRALATGLLPKNLSANKHHLDANLKLMINSLLSRMVKEEQAENELQHIQQLMTQGEVPSTVAQEYERIYADRESLKLEIQVMSDEIKEATQGFSWLHQWKNRNSNSGDTPDGLTAALQSLGIEDAPKIPNPAPWQEGPSATWNEPAPISINTDLERPSHLDESGALKPGGPQEFVPGKKWEWRDPAKVAEDPNATPGSVKPSFASPNWGNGSCDPWTEKPEKKSGSTEEASEK